MAFQSQIYADLSLIQQQQYQLVSRQFQPYEINNNNFVSMAFSDIVTRHLENQRVEIDNYMNLQNEQLKLALREQRKKQLMSLIRNLELRGAIVTRKKDQELAKSRKRAMDLQNYIKKMEMENQCWKRIVGESEAMIANLNATIQQLRDKAVNYCDVEDAESCCDVFSEDEEEEESRLMMCRICNSGNSSVLLLPCRHLCCCKACEASVYVCPVCNSAKKGSIDALFS